MASGEAELFAEDAESGIEVDNGDEVFVRCGIGGKAKVAQLEVEGIFARLDRGERESGVGKKAASDCCSARGIKRGRWLWFEMKDAAFGIEAAARAQRNVEFD